jgi:hypothetical protein
MGAEQFGAFYEGDDLAKVHQDAVAKAQYDHGHSGYSGTLAEKPEVVLRTEKVFEFPEDAQAFADADLRKNPHDKWGPAWAVKVSIPKGFYIYGYASS